MAEDINFNINLTGAGVTAEQPNPQEEAQQTAQPQANNPAQPVSATRNAVFASVAINTAKRLGTYVANNIGEWTGNSLTQQRVNDAMKLISYGTMIAVDPSPFKIASIAAIGVDLGTQAIDYAVDRKWQKVEYERAVRRMGLGSFRNQ